MVWLLIKDKKGISLVNLTMVERINITDNELEIIMAYEKDEYSPVIKVKIDEAEEIRALGWYETIELLRAKVSKKENKK